MPRTSSTRSAAAASAAALAATASAAAAAAGAAPMEWEASAQGYGGKRTAASTGVSSSTRKRAPAVSPAAHPGASPGAPPEPSPADAAVASPALSPAASSGLLQAPSPSGLELRTGHAAGSAARWQSRASIGEAAEHSLRRTAAWDATDEFPSHGTRRNAARNSHPTTNPTADATTSDHASILASDATSSAAAGQWASTSDDHTTILASTAASSAAAAYTSDQTPARSNRSHRTESATWKDEPKTAALRDTCAKAMAKMQSLAVKLPAQEQFARRVDQLNTLNSCLQSAHHNLVFLGPAGYGKSFLINELLWPAGQGRVPLPARADAHAVTKIITRFSAFPSTPAKKPDQSPSRSDFEVQVHYFESALAINLLKQPAGQTLSGHRRNHSTSVMRPVEDATETTLQTARERIQALEGSVPTMETLTERLTHLNNLISTDPVLTRVVKWVQVFGAFEHVPADISLVDVMGWGDVDPWHIEGLTELLNETSVAMIGSQRVIAEEELAPLMEVLSRCIDKRVNRTAERVAGYATQHDDRLLNDSTPLIVNVISSYDEANISQREHIAKELSARIDNALDMSLRPSSDYAIRRTRRDWSLMLAAHPTVFFRKYDKLPYNFAVQLEQIRFRQMQALFANFMHSYAATVTNARLLVSKDQKDIAWMDNVDAWERCINKAVNSAPAAGQVAASSEAASSKPLPEESDTATEDHLGAFFVGMRGSLLALAGQRLHDPNVTPNLLEKACKAFLKGGFLDNLLLAIRKNLVDTAILVGFNFVRKALPAEYVETVLPAGTKVKTHVFNFLTSIPAPPADEDPLDYYLWHPDSLVLGALQADEDAVAANPIVQSMVASFWQLFCPAVQQVMVDSTSQLREQMELISQQHLPELVGSLWPVLDNHRKSIVDEAILMTFNSQQQAFFAEIRQAATAGIQNMLRTLQKKPPFAEPGGSPMTTEVRDKVQEVFDCSKNLASQARMLEVHVDAKHVSTSNNMRLPDAGDQLLQQLKTRLQSRTIPASKKLPQRSGKKKDRAGRKADTAASSEPPASSEPSSQSIIANILRARSQLVVSYNILQSDPAAAGGFAAAGVATSDMAAEATPVATVRRAKLEFVSLSSRLQRGATGSYQSGEGESEGEHEDMNVSLQNSEADSNAIQPLHEAILTLRSEDKKWLDMYFDKLQTRQPLQSTTARDGVTPQPMMDLLQPGSARRQQQCLWPIVRVIHNVHEVAELQVDGFVHREKEKNKFKLVADERQAFLHAVFYVCPTEEIADNVTAKLRSICTVSDFPTPLIDGSVMVVEADFGERPGVYGDRAASQPPPKAQVSMVMEFFRALCQSKKAGYFWLIPHNLRSMREYRPMTVSTRTCTVAAALWQCESVMEQLDAACLRELCSQNLTSLFLSGDTALPVNIRSLLQLMEYLSKGEKIKSCRQLIEVAIDELKVPVKELSRICETLTPFLRAATVYTLFSKYAVTYMLQQPKDMVTEVRLKPKHNYLAPILFNVTACASQPWYTRKRVWQDALGAVKTYVSDLNDSGLVQVVNHRVNFDLSLAVKSEAVEDEEAVEGQEEVKKKESQSAMASLSRENQEEEVSGSVTGAAVMSRGMSTADAKQGTLRQAKRSISKQQRSGPPRRKRLPFSNLEDEPDSDDPDDEDYVVGQ